jgi:hypothetical protein
VSEFLGSAAQKMGVPEALVKRAAEARAKASGADTDAVLSAWAGGEAAPASTPPPVADAPAAPQPEAAATSEPAPAPEPAAGPAATAAPVVVASGPTKPPILVGREERLVGTVAGAAALLALSLLVGFAVASTPEESNLAYTSEVAFSEIGLAGQQVYRSEGCAACHTQVVRLVVADAGFGAVSVSDTNQVIGSRRIGPDLAHVGSRVETDVDIYAALDGAGGHPAYRGLAQSDLDALVVYLMESK